MIPAPNNIAELSQILAGANSRKEKIAHVDLSALNRVVEYTPEDMTVTVETGITLAELQEHLGRHRQWLAIDPSARAVASAPGAGFVRRENWGGSLPPSPTIAEIINTNASGPRRFGLGTIRDYLIGLTVVLADGTVIHSGGKVVKNVAGYDLMKLFVGGQGTVGAVVEATFKLRPVQEVERFVSATGKSLEETEKLLEALMQSPVTPIVLDLYAEPIYPVNALFSPAGREAVQKPPVIKSFTAVIGFAGTAEEVEWQLARAAELGFTQPASLDYETTFWADSARVFRDSVLPSKLIETLKSAPVPCLARAGNGVIYYRDNGVGANTSLDFMMNKSLQRLKDAYDPNRVKLSQRLKDAYDPNHILPEMRYVSRIA